MLTKRSLLLAAAAVIPLLGLSEMASAKEAKKL
ncbi:MAG: sugar ABC transporter substrate-binding protein, partial [Mesorhizobium sp.]